MDENALTADEAKYFETGGEAPPAIEQKAPEAAEQKSAEEPAPKEPEAKKEAPPEIEIVEDDDGSEPDARKYVKVGVLRREREARKQARQEALALQQQMADLRRQIEEAKSPPRELTPEELPHVALERVQSLEQQLAQQAAKSNFVATWQQKAAEYTKDQADFPDAYRHALGVRRTMYEEAGFPPQQVAALLESEEASIVERALIAGENPAEKFYKIAKTLGYTPKAKEAKKDDPTSKVVEAAEKLAQIQKGMEKNKSVSGGGGADAAPTLTELADMDDAEFEKATSGDNWKKMMGG